MVSGMDPERLISYEIPEYLVERYQILVDMEKAGEISAAEKSELDSFIDDQPCHQPGKVNGDEEACCCMSYIPKAFRLFVSHRAAFRCEYCKVPDLGFAFPFQIDHIRAIKRWRMPLDGNFSRMSKLSFSAVASDLCK